MKLKLWMAFSVLVMIVIVIFMAGSTNAHAKTNNAKFQANVYRNAQKTMRELHITKLNWDGRWSYSERSEMCVETFNGTNHNIRLNHYKWTVGTGLYIKWCNSNYYTSDSPFPHMHSFGR